MKPSSAVHQIGARPISNRASPHRVGGDDTSEYALGVAMHDRYAYVADSEGGLLILELSHLELLPLSYTSTDGFRFSISGRAGDTVQLQRSTNLRDWSDWGAPIILDASPTERTDAEAASATQFFYRTVTH